MMPVLELNYISYHIAGKFGGETKFGELTLLEYLAEESLAN